ncbi:MAG: ferritin-like domain-containing protein [Nannocystaceae bacterium]|nr:ferritin-like domain-containing protein [Nannocystaceae bacterium]
MDPLTAPPAHVGEEWMRRVEAEYRSCAITASFVQWLIRLGAPPELIREGLRIVDDELEHATLSHVVARDAGCETRPGLVQESLCLARNDVPLWVDGLWVAVETFCLGETVAVPLFVAMRDDCAIDSARAALDRIVRDEVRHRDFGWASLDWFTQTRPEHTRLHVERALPDMMQRLRRNYGQASALPSAKPSATDAQWGLLPSARYAEILERSIRRDFMPRFETLGIDPTLCTA